MNAGDKMANFRCNIRNARTLLLLAITAIATYVPLKALYMLAASREPTVSDSGRVQRSGQADHHHIPVSVKDIIPSSGGKLDVVLSLDAKELLQYLDGSSLGGEATRNPVPPSVGYVKHNPNLCKNEPNLKYIIYVHTSPGYVARRALIRSTWANKNLFKDRRTQLVFLSGMADAKNHQEELDKEFAEHKDIVVGNFQDHYRNLTLKGIMGLKWISEYCQNAQYAIKADDDAFVNIFEVMKIVDRHSDSKRLVVCPFWKDNSMPILRDPAKCMKWCVKYTEFPGLNYFPKYCAGLSFLLGRELILQMYEKVQSTPFFWIDDVYVTGLLLNKLSYVDYIDLLRNFTLKEEKAMEQYLDHSVPITYYYVHIKKPENFPTLWQGLLERTSVEVLKTLNEEVFADFPKVKEKLAGTGGRIMQQPLGGAR